MIGVSLRHTLERKREMIEMISLLYSLSSRSLSPLLWPEREGFSSSFFCLCPLTDLGFRLSRVQAGRYGKEETQESHCHIGQSLVFIAFSNPPAFIYFSESVDSTVHICSRVLTFNQWEGEGKVWLLHLSSNQRPVDK